MSFRGEPSDRDQRLFVILTRIGGGVLVALALWAAVGRLRSGLRAARLGARQAHRAGRLRRWVTIDERGRPLLGYPSRGC